MSYAGHPQSNFFLKSANEDYIYLANDVSVVRACNSIADISLKQLIILQAEEKKVYICLEQYLLLTSAQVMGLTNK